MRLLSEPLRRLFELPFHSAAPGNRRRVETLYIDQAQVDFLPGPLEALVVTSDLQGREIVADDTRAGAPAPARLIGESVAGALSDLADRGLIPPAAATGVLLCGDLYAAPGADRRGATGDVTAVWRAFAERFRWVAGVAGNHDAFPEGTAPLVALDNVHYFDGDSTMLDGLCIGGVSGITGRLSKHNRKDPDTFQSLVDGLLLGGVDVLCLHEGPSGPGQLPGNSDLRELLELAPRVYDKESPLVACGHVAWPRPMCELRGGTQVLNVDSRVVVLTPSG